LKAIFVLPAVAAALALTACSTTVHGVGLPVGAGPSGFASSGASSSGSSTSSDGPAGARTTAQLTAAALRVQDLDGSGWSATPADNSGDDSDDDDSGCGSDDTIAAANQAEVDFSQGTLGPFFFESLASAADSTSAKAEFAKAQAEFTNCPATDDDGDTLSVTPMSFPSLGDQSAGYRITETPSATASTSGFGTPVSISIVLVRDGRVLESYGYFALTGGSSSSFETMVKAGVARAHVVR
jgi:hypothetical protein